MNVLQQAVKAATNLVPESNDFSASNWFYRRVIIMCALVLCAVIVIVITAVVAGSITLSVWRGNALNVDPNLLRLAETLLWTTFTFAGGIIGTYVFGANWDTKDYRRAVLELQKTPVVTSTTTTVETAVVPAKNVEDKGEQPDEEPANPDPVKEEKKGPVG